MTAYRSFLLVALLVAVCLCLAPAPAVAAEDDNPTAAARAATTLLTAINTGDADELNELTGGLGARDIELARAIDIQQFQLRRAWFLEKQAFVEFEWIACFDHERFAEATLPAMRTAWQEAGVDADRAEKQYLGQLVQLRGLVEQPSQVMVLARYGADSWRPTRQWFGARAPGADPVVLHEPVQFLEPDESECGGATPEEVTARVLAAWKSRNVVDVVWCSQPGQPRRWYASTDKTMLVAMKLEEFSVGRVWLRGDMAWVEYTWTASFLERPYFEYMARQLKAEPEHQRKSDAEQRQAMQALMQTVKQLKETIEQGTHFMRLRRHGDRWYNAGDPLGVREPDWEPARNAGDTAGDGNDTGDDQDAPTDE